MKNKLYFTIFLFIFSCFTSFFTNTMAEETVKDNLKQVNTPENHTQEKILKQPKFVTSHSSTVLRNIKKSDISFTTDIEKYEIPKTSNIQTLNTTNTEESNPSGSVISEIPTNPSKTKQEDSNNKDDKDIITPEESVEMVYKGSIVLNGQKIIYFGSSEVVEAITRSLDIQAAIKDAVYKAARDKHYNLLTEIKPYGSDYVLYLNNEPILRVTDIDAQINNLDKKQLSELWKYNIDNFVRKNIRKVKILTRIELFQNLAVTFIVMFLIIGCLELLRVKSKNRIKKLMKICLHKIQKTVHQIRIKRSKSIYEAPEDLIKSQIEHIADQTSIIIDIFVKIIQFIVFFIAMIVVFYEIPDTYMYINEFAHYLISYFAVGIFSFGAWLTSKETWGTIIGLLFIILQACIIIYIFKICYSIIKNIIHIMIPGNRVKIKRLETIFLIILRTLEIIIAVIAFFLILMELGINLGPILAGAGIAGLAVSFGAQNMIKDIINGLFILTENQFGIGDWIKIGDCAGTVEDMTLRTTLIRDLSGVVHIIPNGQITQVSVYTKNWSRANLDINIAYKEDIDTAIRLIKETANKMHEELPNLIIAEPRVLGVNALGESSVDIKLVMDTIAGEQWQVEREFRRRIKYVFDQNNIEIPFPHRTVYIRKEDEYNT